MLALCAVNEKFSPLSVHASRQSQRSGPVPRRCQVSKEACSQIGAVWCNKPLLYFISEMSYPVHHRKPGNHSPWSEGTISAMFGFCRKEKHNHINPRKARSEYRVSPHALESVYDLRDCSGSVRANQTEAVTASSIIAPVFHEQVSAALGGH